MNDTLFFIATSFIPFTIFVLLICIAWWLKNIYNSIEKTLKEYGVYNTRAHFTLLFIDPQKQW